MDDRPAVGPEVVVAGSQMLRRSSRGRCRNPGRRCNRAPRVAGRRSRPASHRWTSWLEPSGSCPARWFGRTATAVVGGSSGPPRCPRGGRGRTEHGMIAPSGPAPIVSPAHPVATTQRQQGDVPSMARHRGSDCVRRFMGTSSMHYPSHHGSSPPAPHHGSPHCGRITERYRPPRRTPAPSDPVRRSWWRRPCRDCPFCDDGQRRPGAI